MCAAANLEGLIPVDHSLGFGHGSMGVKEALLVFDGPQLVLEERNFPPHALAIHVDLEVAPGKQLDEDGLHETVALTGR